MKMLSALLLVLFSLPALAAPEPEFLIRAKRQARDDLTTLRSAGLPVVHETLKSLFLQGTQADVAALRGRGFEVDVLDRDPAKSDYLQVGLRSDSDRAILFALGAELFAEENWKLIRVPRGASLEPLHEARVFVTRLPNQPVPLTLSTPLPTPRAAPDSRTATETDPLIQRMVNAVDPAHIDRYWTDLTDNPPTGTRFTRSLGCEDAAEYCRAELEAVRLPAELQSYHPSHAPNVIGTHRGAVTPDHVYIVIGHLDDLPHHGLAPGADDNASGSVTVLESARVLSCYAFKSTVKFIVCTGEELGHLGSNAYAADAQARGEDIRGVLNFDMNGWEGDGTPNPENLDLNFNEASELGLLFAQAAADYNTGLVVDAFLCPSLTFSDHQSFWSRGYKAICAITDNEGYCGHGGYYPQYHTQSDTIENCGDPSFFYSTVKTAVATLATLAEPFKVTFENPTVPLGQTARLVLGDRDLNASPSSAETVSVEVWSTTEPTAETFVLSEDGLDSMIFAGDVPTSTENPVAGDGVVSVSDGDLITVRYVDALDCDGNTNVTYMAEASAEESACDNDGTCESGEDCNNCPDDCIGGSTAGAVCGNGVCEAGDGEDCVSCPSDCSGKQSGKPSGRFCCGDGDGQNPLSCSDATCSTGGWSCTDEPSGGGTTYCCGDGVCEGAEDTNGCLLDCAECAVDADCDDGNTCTTDSCDAQLGCINEDPACGDNDGCCPAGCDNGNDNDCFACGERNDPCNSDSDCCSNQCKGNGRCK